MYDCDVVDNVGDKYMGCVCVCGGGERGTCVVGIQVLAGCCVVVVWLVGVGVGGREWGTRGSVLYEWGFFLVAKSTRNQRKRMYGSFHE